MDLIRRVLSILELKERRFFFVLILMILLMGLLEVVGIVSILPFIQLVADPSVIETNSVLKSIYDWMGFEDHRSMLFWAGGAVIITILFVNAYIVFASWVKMKFTWGLAHRMSQRLLSAYLTKPYGFFLKSNSAYLASYVIAEVSTLVSSVILPLVEIFSRGFVALVLFGLLMFVDFKVASIMFLVLGASYVVIYLLQRNFLRRLGEKRIAMNTKRFKSLLEAFDGIKTVMVYRKNKLFHDRFSEGSLGFNEIQPKFHVAQSAPRNILEVLAFSAIVSITIYLYLSAGNFANIVPKLTLYALAGYRLIPALQNAFSAAAKIRNGLPALEKIYDELLSVRMTPGLLHHTDDQPESLVGDIELSNVSFTYPETDKPVIDDIKISIREGEKVAFVGSTGSGKTTLVDLILGLHKPDMGQVSVNGEVIDERNIDNWRSSIAYVPQDVFLFDDQIDRNITFTSSIDKIDTKLLEDVLSTADLSNFIASLPDGTKTMIGEKGVRISGGQKQRIGLARALYSQPEVLVLDEATSALDNITERGINEALENLPIKITTIIIAHRLSTVRHADRIYLLEKGKISAAGTYDQLIDSSDVFREMAQDTLT